MQLMLSVSGILKMSYLLVPTLWIFFVFLLFISSFIVIESPLYKRISGKNKTGVAFTQTQEKGEKDKKKENIKYESHCFHCGKQDHCAADFPILEEEQRGQIHTNVVIVKD